MNQQSTPILYPMTGGILLNTQRGSCLEKPPQHLSKQPDKLIFPLHSNYCHYTPIVKSGDTVIARQVIAQAKTTDKQIQQLHTGLGGIVHIQNKQILIEVNSDQSLHHIVPQRLTVNTPEDLQQLLYAQGILGLGGAMFPSGNKLQQRTRENETIHTLLVNGVECEPMLTADACLMTHYSSHIIIGIQRLLHILNIPRGIIAIEADKPLAIQTIQNALLKQKEKEKEKNSANTTDIQLRTIKTLYPAGGSRQLYEQLFGRRLKGSEHSIQHGVLTLNVHTIAAITDALAGKPLTHRIVTIAGQVLHSPQNIWLPIGTPLSWIQKQLPQSTLLQDTEITYGGPLMGQTITNQQEPIRAGTAAVLFQPKQQVQERPCIQCGDCNPVCPEELQPQTLLQFIHAKQVQQHNPSADEGLENFNLSDCILCGACDLVCPSSIPLASLFKSEQKHLKEIHNRNAAAERAKQLYEARQTRLAKPKRSNPPKPAPLQTTKQPITRQKTTTQKANPTTRLKTKLAKAQRLYRESTAALEQAKKKNLDESTLAQYQERVNQMRLKAQAAQHALNQAKSTD